jgi:tRNA-specific 2-thiouridylase
MVMDRFVSAYEDGRTPNPCIDCNRYIKFEKLLLRARQSGCDSIATGHYSRIERDNASGRFLLKKALDTTKDQSYVLYSMTQDQLAHTLMPLGRLKKAEVREIALSQGFVNARKRESQDICFAPDGDYAGFIERRSGRTGEPGRFIDENGKVLGTHKGIIRYTIGQRRRLGLQSSAGLYVCRKNARDNTVTLGRSESLYSSVLMVNEVNLISADSLTSPTRVWVRSRYRQEEQPAVAEQIAPDTIRIEFDEPQRAAAPGQAAVMYDGDTVIGGGTITAQGGSAKIWKADLSLEV